MGFSLWESVSTEKTEKEILDALNHPYIAGLTLLGGEPFEPENQRELVKLLKKSPGNVSKEKYLELFRVCI